ncbi:hypothetical protein QQF64_017158 [Cirrhinus molitorella]|uniref:Uncharacterized protein n=1 Tax=Cirrhinus molitorella TaxID=172907 RepID=A0ABR3LJ90_9TELE
MSDHAVVNNVYPPAHTQNENARCHLYAHTAYMCDKEEQSGPFIQALSQSAARGKRGWSVTNRSPVLHHWAPGAASEKEEKIRMKSKPSPLALSLNFSSMSQRQSDSLDALRKRSMTSPRSFSLSVSVCVCVYVCLEGGWLNESSASNRSIPAVTVSLHS